MQPETGSDMTGARTALGYATEACKQDRASSLRDARTTIAHPDSHLPTLAHPAHTARRAHRRVLRGVVDEVDQDLHGADGIGHGFEFRRALEVDILATITRPHFICRSIDQVGDRGGFPVPRLSAPNSVRLSVSKSSTNRCWRLAAATIRPMRSSRASSDRSYQCACSNSAYPMMAASGVRSSWLTVATKPLRNWASCSVHGSVGPALLEEVGLQPIGLCELPIQLLKANGGGAQGLDERLTLERRHQQERPLPHDATAVVSLPCQ